MNIRLAALATLALCASGALVLHLADDRPPSVIDEPRRADAREALSSDPASFAGSTLAALPGITPGASDPNASVVLGCVAHTPEARAAHVDIYTLPATVRDMEPWRAKYFCPTDFNRDNAIDPGDIALFLAVFAAREGPMVDWLDINEDGTVDDADLDAFMRQYHDGGCDPTYFAENRLLIC